MAKGHITLKYLQEYIKSKDYSPELERDYFLKLSEEVGELAKAIRKQPKPATEYEIKGTIEEELWDIIYYTLAIANCHNIDVEKWIPIKEALNNEKYKTGLVFNPDL